MVFLEEHIEQIIKQGNDHALRVILKYTKKKKVKNRIKKALTVDNRVRKALGSFKEKMEYGNIAVYLKRGSLKGLEEEAIEFLEENVDRIIDNKDTATLKILSEYTKDEKIKTRITSALVNITDEEIIF